MHTGIGKSCCKLPVASTLSVVCANRYKSYCSSSWKIQFIISNYSETVEIWEPMAFKLNLTQMRNNSVDVVQFTPKLKELLLAHYNGHPVTRPCNFKWGMGKRDKASCPQNKKSISAKYVGIILSIKAIMHIIVSLVCWNVHPHLFHLHSLSKIHAATGISCVISLRKVKT